jgi:hypothetical protein
VRVIRCGHCRAYYVRYRRAHPPAGYCSVGCFENRRRKKIKPPPAGFLLSLMRQHRKDAHGTNDLTQWFNCPECERIEARYAAALHDAA